MESPALRVGQLRKEANMKRYFIGFKKPDGFCDHLTVDAIDESDARRQFAELYEGRAYKILCVAQC
jgi:hypothetical protein